MSSLAHPLGSPCASAPTVALSARCWCCQATVPHRAGKCRSCGVLRPGAPLVPTAHGDDNGDAPVSPLSAHADWRALLVAVGSLWTWCGLLVWLS